MNTEEKIQLLKEIMKEFKAASNSAIHFHIDGVSSILQRRIMLGLNVDGSEHNE